MLVTFGNTCHPYQSKEVLCPLFKHLKGDNLDTSAKSKSAADARMCHLPSSGHLEAGISFSGSFPTCGKFSSE